MEVPLASGVSGVVTRDAKGSGQGMITVTDGNNLDMPAQVKFPEARKRLVVVHLSFLHKTICSFFENATYCCQIEFSGFYGCTQEPAP